MARRRLGRRLLDAGLRRELLRALGSLAIDGASISAMPVCELVCGEKLSSRNEASRHDHDERAHPHEHGHDHAHDPQPLT